MTYSNEKPLTPPFETAAEAGSLAVTGNFHDFSDPIEKGEVVTSETTPALPGHQVEQRTDMNHGTVPEYESQATLQAA